jgi:hypothetical protein
MDNNILMGKLHLHIPLIFKQTTFIVGYLYHFYWCCLVIMNRNNIVIDDGLFVAKFRTIYMTNQNVCNTQVELFHSYQA